MARAEAGRTKHRSSSSNPVRGAVPERPDFPQISGLTPEITATDDHYVVDINLFAPAVEAEGCTLNVTGLVERPLERPSRNCKAGSRSSRSTRCWSASRTK